MAEVSPALSMSESPVVDGHAVVQLESCHSVWFFDTGARRFLRVPKSSANDAVSLAAPWEDYLDFELCPGGSFVVTLGPDATRRLRAWRHIQPCRLCSHPSTSEVPVAQLLEDGG